MSSVQFGNPFPLICGNRHETVYSVSRTTIAKRLRGSLVDRGANGGILGNDARVILQHQREVDVTGIDNHEINNLRIVDASAKTITQFGPAIVILRQYAYHGVGTTIHSCGQIEAYKNMVDDRSNKLGGTQCIRTQEGYIIPLDSINGLPYMKLVPNTNKEWNELPHVILTSGEEWKPTSIDSIITDKEDWYNSIKRDDDGLTQTNFDKFGNYLHREPVPEIQEIQDPSTEVNVTESEPDEMDLREAFIAASNVNQVCVCCDLEVDDSTTMPREVKKRRVNYEKCKPYFCHAPLDKIRRTFENTTQFATNIMSGSNLQQTIKQVSVSSP